MRAPMMSMWTLCASLFFAPVLASAAPDGAWEAANDVAVEAMDAQLRAELAQQVPRATRAGFLQLRGPGFDLPEAAPWALQRTADASVDPSWQRAYAGLAAALLVNQPVGDTLSVQQQGWMDLALHHPETAVRGALLSGLRKAAPELAVPTLRKALGHEVAATREVAAFEAGMGSFAPLAADLVPLLRDDAAVVRGAAARSLGILGHAAASAELATAARDGDADVRRHALRALSRVDASAAAKVAVSLVEDSDDKVRRLAQSLAETAGQ